jgi:hypothetical protein
MDLATLGSAGELGIVVVLCQTIMELTKFAIHRKRVSQGKAHDSLTIEEHGMLNHLHNESDIYSACTKLQNDMRLISSLNQIEDSLNSIEHILKRSYPPR